MASTRTAWGRSLQPMSENGTLAPPRSRRIAPNRIITVQASFGIIPAPGNASVPNGKSLLTASTASAAAMAAPPAMWSARIFMDLVGSIVFTQLSGVISVTLPTRGKKSESRARSDRHTKDTIAPKCAILGKNSMAEPPCERENPTPITPRTNVQGRKWMELLKLVALDQDDLEVVSTHLQDATLSVGDVHWRPSEKRLVMSLARFDWAGSLCESAQFQRRRTALRFDRV